MTKEKIIGVINLYGRKLTLMGIKKNKNPHNRRNIGNPIVVKLGHCHQMMDEMRVFIEEGRLEKVQRWLGFIQGVFWAEGIYSIDELKHHSMTGGEEPQNHSI